MNADDSIEEIDRYIKGDMTEPEKIAFEMKLQLDASLFERVEKQRALNRLIIEAGLIDIRQMMYNDLKPKSNKTKSTWIGGGIAFLILSTIGIYLYSKEDKNLIAPKESNTSTPLTIEEGKTNSTNNNTTFPLPQKRMVSEDVKQTSDNSISSNIAVTSSNDILIDGTQKIEIKEKQTNTENYKETIVQKANCDNFNPKYSMKIIPSTIHKANGRILITTKESLVFTLANGAVLFGGSFDELAAGNYELNIEDDKGCKTLITNVLVGQTFCIELEKETFSPVNDNIFHLPVEALEIEEVRIYNNRMQQIRIFKSGSLLEWDGRDSEGLLVETGLYKFEVRYKNGERCLFNLTVFN